MKTTLKKVGMGVGIPVLVFLFFVSVIYADSMDQITATITVHPSAENECYPDALVIGSNSTWIYCLIELTGADVNNINVNTVKLGLTTSSCSVPADPTFFFVNDFDRDGVEDALVRFSRAAADTNCFGPPASTTDFELLVTGEVGEFPFSGTDDLLYFKPPSMQFSRHFQLGAINSLQGKMHNYTGINLTTYSPSNLHFAGYALCTGDPNCSGFSAFYSQGRQAVPVTFKLFGVPVTINTFRFVQTTFRIQDYRQCFIDPIIKIIDCEGEGLIVVSYGNGTQFRKILPFAHFHVENFKALIEGGNNFSDEVFIGNVPVNIMRIR
jgi:hypothetical protein